MVYFVKWCLFECGFGWVWAFYFGLIGGVEFLLWCLLCSLVVSSVCGVGLVVGVLLVLVLLDVFGFRLPGLFGYC